ncbi:MAG: GNAT family N-acetyltransferase [Coriobacteriia bacterium]|nr:GNAT family N-acetyltransferase [Coriobacteriia bacterium]
MMIRVMSIDDYDAVYQLWMNTPGMGLNTSDDSREGIAMYLQRNPTTSFVAVEGEEIIGVIMAGHDGRRGFIHHTAVKTSERAKGLGSALVDAAMGALKEEGINKVAMIVFSKNDLGNAFWENRGFTTREDLVYRNKNINDLIQINT